MLITAQSNKYGVFLLVIWLVLIIFLPKDAPASNHDNILNLATGSKTGVYYPVGQGIAEAVKESNIKINVLSSEGSIENLNWLEEGKVQLCLAQSDIAYNAYNGLGRFPSKLSNIRTISSLYTEAVHIIVRNPLYIRKIEDMKGKRISVGPKGGGTESNALTVLEASGLTQDEFKLLNLSFDEGVKAIRENKTCFNGVRS
jgi:TRAP transporter TAXI family solute receptor